MLPDRRFLCNTGLAQRLATQAALFSYETVKVVRVRDKRLFFLQYFLMFLIFAYVVGYTLIWQQRYLVTGIPSGSVRLTLQAPTTRTNQSLLQYCLEPNRTTMNGFLNFPCLYWDDAFALFPAVEDHDMFITTRVNMTFETLPNCSLEDYRCAYNSSAPDVYFIPDIENFTIMVDHTLFVPGILRNPISANTLQGAFYNSDMGKMEFPPTDKNNIIGRTNGPDIMQIATILEAAGVDLDTVAETKNAYDLPVSKRYDGIVILLFIEYSNLRDVSFDLRRIEYAFRAQIVTGAKFSATQAVYTKNLDTREIWTRHGIRIVFVQTGILGKFDFQALLLSFVGGLGLMTAASFAIDLLATKILPAKVVYNKYKYEDTHDINQGLFQAVGDEGGFPPMAREGEREALIQKK